MKIGKKLVATLFGISAIGGVAAVASLGLTNCGEEQALEKIIRDADVGIIGGQQIPSDDQIWEWVVDSNPNISSTDLNLARVNILNKTLNDCDVTAKPHSGFTGTVHLTYNTIDPKLILWLNGSQSYDTMMNLTSRYVGQAIIHTGSNNYTHNYSFYFIANDGTLIQTPNMGGPATGYHFDNLQVKQNNSNATWSIDPEKCIRCKSKSQGFDAITFDIRADGNDALVISMALNLTYQYN